MFPEKVPKRLHSLLLTRMLNEFTNPYGIRALSRYHSEHSGWSSSSALSLRQLRTPPAAQTNDVGFGPWRVRQT